MGTTKDLDPKPPPDQPPGGGPPPYELWWRSDPDAQDNQDAVCICRLYAVDHAEHAIAAAGRECYYPHELYFKRRAYREEEGVYVVVPTTGFLLQGCPMRDLRTIRPVLGPLHAPCAMLPAGVTVHEGEESPAPAPAPHFPARDTRNKSCD